MQKMNIFLVKQRKKRQESLDICTIMYNFAGVLNKYTNDED